MEAQASQSIGLFAALGAAYLAWRRAKTNLPVALFGGLAVWWLVCWVLSTT